MIKKECNHLSYSLYLDYFNLFVSLKILAVDLPIYKDSFLYEFLCRRIKRLGTTNRYLKKGGRPEHFPSFRVSRILSIKRNFVELLGNGTQEKFHI